eukprot:Tamp_01560.p1 GENE.Tamp_01560~~Tamp_01560.p1  ORF type:complete len:1188 (+),score=117.48 Tamp_01560:1247-4810(+)
MLGNTGAATACSWECDEAYTVTGPLARACPPDTCCAALGSCFLPSPDQISDGRPAAAMEMLTNCLNMVPIHTPTARDTMTAFNRLLGQDGAYVNYDVPSSVEGTSRGDMIAQVIAQVSMNLVDADGTDPSGLPRKTDWTHVHGALMQGLRAVKDEGLAYAPPVFYQELSYYLPWSLRVAPTKDWLSLTNCAVPGAIASYACSDLYIKGINAAVQNHARRGAAMFEQPCSCATCACDPLPPGVGVETFVGWKVTGIDTDGSGTRPAMQVLQTFSNELAHGNEPGSRLRFSLESGEPLSGYATVSNPPGAPPNSHFGAHRGGGGEGSWLGAAEGSAGTLYSDSAGQVGCSFTHRLVSGCGMPTCSAAWCHVRFELSSPDGTETKVLDVPWTVVYGGNKGLHPWSEGTPVSCHADTGAPFRNNVECMRRTVTFGDAAATENQAPGIRKRINCAARSNQAMKGGGLVPPPFALPLPAPSPNLFRGECSMQGLFHDLGIGKRAEQPLLADAASTVGDFNAASAYVLVNPQTGERTGVLALRSFVESQLAIHAVLAELAAARVDALLIDVRGNTGGDTCHIYELAYLVSNHLNSPGDAQERLGMHVRRSDLLDQLVFGESMAAGTRIPNQPVAPGTISDEASVNQLDNICSVQLTRNLAEEERDAARARGNASMDSQTKAALPTQHEQDWRYSCAADGGVDTDFYACAESSACMGPSAWKARADCAPCPPEVAGIKSDWSHAFRPRCSSSARGASLLEFAASEGGTCSTGGMDGEVIRTTKAWSGCATCLEEGNCAESAVCGFDKSSLTILSDGRCLGACAMFVRIMEEGDLAHVVTPFSNPPALAASAEAPALLTTGSLVYCQLSAEENANISADPSVARPFLPLAGQEVLLPLSRAVFADQGRFENRSKLTGGIVGGGEQGMIRHFPASNKAAYCLPTLYQEAWAASQMCAFNPAEEIKDMLLGLGHEFCTMAHALSATRTCNSSCVDVQSVCTQYKPFLAGSCRPVCWSKCSALECREGFERVWISDRYLCLSVFDTMDASFKIGAAYGRKKAEEEWSQRYGWRANMSGGGVALLSVFLLVLGAVGGRLSATGQLGGEGVSLPCLGEGTGAQASSALGRASTVAGEVLSAMLAAGAAAAAVVIAGVVALYTFVKDKVESRGGAGAGDMTVHLPSAGAPQDGGEGDNYHAL